MQDPSCDSHTSFDRRSFLKKGIAAGAVGVGVGFSLLNNNSALAESEGTEERSGSLSKGDAAMLRFAAAAEILESDFWVQYNELGGIQDNEVRGGSGNPIYTKKLQVLDSDFPQYIHDNTDDEITHFTFLNAYLESKGADPVDLDQFRVLSGSTATGSSQKTKANKSHAAHS